MRTVPCVQRCAPGGRVRGQCCTALMDTRRGPCRPLASSSAPTGSTAHLSAGWFRLGAQPTDLLEFLPASGVTIQTCSCMQRTRLSLSHFAHYWTCRASQLGAQATGAPLSLPTRTSEFRGCGSVGPPRLAEGRRSATAEPLVFSNFPNIPENPRFHPLLVNSFPSKYQLHNK